MIIGVVLVLALAAAACGDGREQTVAAEELDSPAASEPESNDGAPGVVQVRLEPVEGFFVEGFEIGLRFETGEGTLISATLWSDFIRSTGKTDIDAFYDSVLSQPVPAGTVRVAAKVNIGTGPAPEVPDLDGELPCELVIEIDSEVETIVEVTFDGSDDCLRILDGSGGSRDEPETTGSTSTSTTASTVPPGPPSLEVGTTHYVDVDLECQAFELGGIWVLAEGDTSTWQPPGERHEGGMFTIESPGRGRFVGDAQGEKTATFERVDDAVDPACVPLPRPTS